MSNQKSSKPAQEKTETKKAPAAPAAHQGAPSNVVSMKPTAAAKVGCLVITCKSNDTRFGFCEDHFHQYKFGLITKTGMKVLDYEKKFEHYQSWIASQVGGRSKTLKVA